MFLLLKLLTYSQSQQQTPLEGDLEVEFQITVHQDLVGQYKNDPSTVSNCYFLHQLIASSHTHIYTALILIC